MPRDNTYQDALPRLAEGIRKCAAVVANTMGPKGSNIALQVNLPPYTITTNDGATIIKAMELSDPIERMGLSYLKEAVDRSNSNAGDGSTTTSILLDAIIQGGIASGANPMELKASLDSCLPLIEASIHDQTRQITVADILAVARIAGESEELATVLGEIYKVIGADGIIHLEGSGTYETTYGLIEGVRFIDTGYLSPYMANEGKKAVYQNPQILVTKNKIGHLKDIDPVLQALIANGVKSLVIFTDDMDSGVARTLIELQKNEKRSIDILIIKAPTLWKGFVFEDFAKCVGATIIEDSSGTSLGNKFRLEWLGSCETLITDKEETTLIGIKDIKDHVLDLEKEGTTDSKLRLSWLTTKTAILKLGAKSETELSYLRLKAEDAIFSSRSALKYGIVAGGGVSLRNCVEALPDTFGGLILKKALKVPITQIMTNAGAVPIVEQLEGEMGYNAKDLSVVNMFDAGIVDSSAIVLGAIRNALGIASTLLTISSVITLPPPTQEEILSKRAFNPMMGM